MALRNDMKIVRLENEHVHPFTLNAKYVSDWRLTSTIDLSFRSTLRELN